MRIPEWLMTEKIHKSHAFQVYDEALKNQTVGMAKTKAATTAKALTTTKGGEKGKKLVIRSKKIARQPKRKLTITDETTKEEDEGETLRKNIVKVKNEKEKKDKGKVVESEESSPSPLTEKKEANY